MPRHPQAAPAPAPHLTPHLAHTTCARLTAAALELDVLAGKVDDPAIGEALRDVGRRVYGEVVILITASREVVR